MHTALITNDDGIFAPGLSALALAFLQDGWQVVVCAPDGQRSATSHSITIKRPLVVTDAELPGLSGAITAYKCDGTPADCTKVALHALLKEKPDLVVSGINNGWNAGTDVHYSGTVGAAMEGAIEGVQAMAVSLEKPTTSRYAYGGILAARLARRLLQNPLPLPAILNLNLPDLAPEGIRGLVEAPLSRIRYTDTYDRLPHSPHRRAFWLRGEIIRESCLPGGDLSLLLEGYATVTAVGWDLTLPGGLAKILQDA